MKKIKLFVKTLLFSAFMTVVVSTTGNTVNHIQELTVNFIPVCCEECPSAESSDAGF